MGNQENPEFIGLGNQRIPLLGGFLAWATKKIRNSLAWATKNSFIAGFLGLGSQGNPESIGLGNRLSFAPGPRVTLGIASSLELSVRSYLVGNAGSRLISEAKQPWACLVLRWGTTGEAHVLYSLQTFQFLKQGGLNGLGDFGGCTVFPSC